AFTLDTTKNPKNITIITDFDGARYPSKGVYELDGDDLKICIDFNHVGKRNYEAATELKTKAGSLLLLYSFKRQKANKEAFTAWGKEVGGLQAGLGFRAGEKRAYHHGETVKLVVRVRNVGKEPVKFEYLREFFMETPPTATDSQGKPVLSGRVDVFGSIHLPLQVTLATGQDNHLFPLK